MISAEGPPLQRAGALIDIMDGLPRELRKRGHQVSVTLPYHREIRENSKFKAKRTGIAVDVRVGDKAYVQSTSRGEVRAGCSCFWLAATIFLIGREFPASTASPTEITPRDSFFSARRRWNSPGD